MPRATRSRKATKDTNPQPVEDEPPSLPEADRNPLKLFILPKGVSNDARIICLNDPVRNRPTRYLYCPETGIYEFMKISSPQADPRSWMLQYEKRTGDDQESKTSSEGYLTEGQDIYVATPFDPVFFLLPILSPPTSSKKSRKDMFLTLDDHVDEAPGVSSQFKQLLRTKIAHLIQKRMKTVCDTVEVGDETMFRLSLAKTSEEMMARARKVALNGLPKSMEEHFVSKPLEPPAQLVKNSDAPSSVETSSSGQSDGSIQIAKDQTEDSSKSHNSTRLPDSLTELQRIRTALDFITRSYLPPRLQTQVKDTLSELHPSEFAPLDTYMAAQNALRAEAQALRAISDNISRKRSAEDNDEAADLRVEKKRKKEEEDAKRKMESRTMKQLKKVDTTGMKKMTSFFTKAPVAKAKA